MARIAITQAAFDAIAKTLPLGSVGYENKVNKKGERLIWLSTGRYSARAGRELLRRHIAAGELRAPCNALPEALDPLSQRLRTPAERRVDGRFVSAPRLVAGHGAFVEIRAQARHSVGEAAHVHANERALLCPGQLFLTALRAADSPAGGGAGSYAKAPKATSGRAGRHERQPVGA
jgi:hypothetical protein